MTTPTKTKIKGSKRLARRAAARARRGLSTMANEGGLSGATLGGAYLVGALLGLRPGV